MSKPPTPAPTATNDEIAGYLGVSDDTRRAILRAIGLPKRRRHAWSELWARLGLDPEQPEEVRVHLTRGLDGKNTLWNASRVAEEIGNVASTVNGWCSRGVFPPNFPPPLVDHRRKTRLWLPIEVRAYMESSIYGDTAAQIRRKAKAVEKPAPVEPVVWSGTLEPLPSAGITQK